jgi:hypothetical protein
MKMSDQVAETNQWNGDKMLRFWILSLGQLFFLAVSPSLKIGEPSLE